MDTLPSGCLSTVPELSSRLGCLRRFRLRARLGVPLSKHPGQRGITPAFGYGAPYPSASGTLTHLIWALPSTQYEGSDSCPPRPRQAGLSAYSALPSGHPTPNHVMRSRGRFRSYLSAPGRTEQGPGFAMIQLAHQRTPPKRVRHPAGWPFAFSCSPPRLAATQLPSASYDVTSHGQDSHLTDKTSSRTHWTPDRRRKAPCPG